MQYVKTVLGEIPENEIGVTLAHEHVCCYFEPFYQMLGKGYLDKEELTNKAIEHLLYMKETYQLSTFVDCTPVNIGRDLQVLKEVSQKAGVHIVCSGGFYYTEEVMIRSTPKEYIIEALLQDLKKNNAGVIKFAVEDAEMSALSRKLLSASCQVQKITGLPLVIHTNGRNQNGKKVLDLVLEEGVQAGAVTLGHLSDSSDMDYVAGLLKQGCYGAFDRIYNVADRAYYEQKAKDLAVLWERGFGDRILLSHDGLTFNGFAVEPCVVEYNPYEPIFERLLPEMRKAGFLETEIQQMFTKNVINMLLCR